VVVVIFVVVVVVFCTEVATPLFSAVATPRVGGLYVAVVEVDVPPGGPVVSTGPDFDEELVVGTAAPSRLLVLVALAPPVPEPPPEPPASVEVDVIA